MGRQSECPWTVRFLAILSLVFMLAAVAQIFSGAAEAFLATRSVGPQISINKDNLGDLELKRAVQQAFRTGGLFIPLEDVILSEPGALSGSTGRQQRVATVWIPVQFKVPWFGSFVYGFSREFVISRAAN